MTGLPEPATPASRYETSSGGVGRADSWGAMEIQRRERKLDNPATSAGEAYSLSDGVVDFPSSKELEGDDYTELVLALSADAERIRVPEERLQRIRRTYLDAVRDAKRGRRNRTRRMAALVAAAAFLLGLGATAYAASDAPPGSLLWSLRSAGWNLKVALTSEEAQAELLSSQADSAVSMAEDAVAKCDSKGAAIARQVALERLEEVEAKLAEKGADTGHAAETIARVRARIQELPEPGSPVCDSSGKPAVGNRRGRGGPEASKSSEPGKNDGSEDRTSRPGALPSQGEGQASSGTSEGSASAETGGQPQERPAGGGRSQGKGLGPDNPGRGARAEPKGPMG